MFTIVFIFVSGLKIFLPLPDDVHYNNQQRCVHAAVDLAHYINNKDLIDDKVETV